MCNRGSSSEHQARSQWSGDPAQHGDATKWFDYSETVQDSDEEIEEIAAQNKQNGVSIVHNRRPTGQSMVPPCTAQSLAFHVK